MFCSAQPGSIDASFTVGSGFNGVVYDVKLQPDGKILCGGAFTSYNGVTAHRIARLNSNGTLDATFTPGTTFNENAFYEIRSIDLQSDGKVIVGGNFFISVIPGYFGGDVARLNTNGTIDVTFQVAMNGGPVNSVVVQPDDRIVIGGFFIQHNSYTGGFVGTPCRRIIRMLPNGLVDTSFGLWAPDWGFDAAIWRMKMTPEGHFLVGGDFHEYVNDFNLSPTYAYYLATVSSSGSIGPVYPLLPAPNGMNGSVYALEMNERTGFFAGGAFTSYDVQSKNQITRINTSGFNDNAFSIGSGFGGNFSWVWDMYQLPTGPLYVGGAFTTYNGTSRNNFAKIMSNGTLVSTFNPSFNNAVRGIEVQVDGKILVVGDFTTVNGASKNRIVRLIGDAPVSIVSLFPQVILEGSCASGAAMQDWLRDASLLPLAEPYTALGYTFVGGGGGESSTAAVLGVDDPFNSVIDWVVVELRNAVNPATVVCSRAGLLLRSGLIVNTNAVSPMLFSVPAGNYHIAIRHRNHLGVMTSTPVFMSNQDPENIDFTSTWLGNYGSDAQKNISGIRTLWMGNAKRDNVLKYVGANNDRDQILLRLGGNPAATVSGYYVEDTRMDGVVKYQNANNDRDPILVNIGGVSTGTRLEQLP